MIGDTSQIKQAGAFFPSEKTLNPSDNLEQKRHSLSQGAMDEADDVAHSVPPEEILEQIKALTDNGNYSIRFEKNDDIDQLVVKLVDRHTDETVRQIPTEDLVDTLSKLSDVRGNIVDTVG